MDEIRRIADPDYLPTNRTSPFLLSSSIYTPTHIDIEDILRTRLPTSGITERLIRISPHSHPNANANGKGVSPTSPRRTWWVLDLGSSWHRGTLGKYVDSFFDDANAIVFLAPLSAFDEVCVLFLY